MSEYSRFDPKDDIRQAVIVGRYEILKFFSGKKIFIFGGLYGPALGYGVSVVSLLFYVFMGLLECIVAFIQAFVFTLLTALFTGMAMEEEHEH